MRVLLLWADDASPNLGVRALGRGTATLVNQVWPDAEITFQNYGHRAPQLPFGRLRSLALERVTGRLGMQRWLGEFDLVVDTRSGDSFSDLYGLHRLAVMSAVSELVSQAGIPVVLGPQTIGPFASRRGRVMARNSLRRARLVMARDPQSATEATRLGRPADVVTTDVVFSLPVPAVERTRDVILNISGLLWQQNPHVSAARYRESVTDLYRGLVASGREVTLLSHVVDSPNDDNDVRAVTEFARSNAPGIEVVVPDGLDQVRSVLASATVVVGSRMHACLNALSVGTPAVPLAYSQKFEPLLHSLGWEHAVDLRGDADPVPAVLRHIEHPGLASDVGLTLDRARASLSKAHDVLAGAL